MSAIQPLPHKMSEEEYLAFERASEFKHEYVNGEIIDMAGRVQIIFLFVLIPHLPL
jgi:Uma2 family endonuclease